MTEECAHYSQSPYHPFQNSSQLFPKLLFEPNKTNGVVVGFVLLEKYLFLITSRSYVEGDALCTSAQQSPTPSPWTGTGPRPIGNQAAQMAGEHAKLRLHMCWIRLRTQNRPLSPATISTATSSQWSWKGGGPLFQLIFF